MQNDTSELRNSMGDTTLVFTRKPRWNSNPNPNELSGTRWKLQSLNGRSPEKGSAPTLSFDSKTRFSGYGGCLHFDGTYAATKDDLEFPVPGMKELECMKPTSNGGYDVLAGAVPLYGDYRLNEDRLEIRTINESTYIFVLLVKGDNSTQETAP